MNWLFRIVMYFVGRHLQARLVREAKAQGIAAYLRVLQASRLLIIAGLLAFFFLQTVMLGAFGALVTGVLYWTGGGEQILTLFQVFLCVFLIPTFLLVIALSGRTWYRFSGAKRMVEELRDKRAA